MESRPPQGYPGAPQGYPQTGAPPGYPAQSGQTNTKALLSLIFGILGLFVVPLVGGILAIVFGNMAQRELRERPHETGEGLAKGGIILGWISIAIAILILLFMLLMLAAIMSVPF